MKIKEIKEKIFKCSEPFCDKRSPKIKTLAKYIKEVFKGEVVVELEETSCYKDTMLVGTRLRNPGTREYKGYILKVAIIDDKYKLSSYNRYALKHNNYYYKTFIDHDTTETYRENYEVCRQIVELHKLLNK